MRFATLEQWLAWQESLHPNAIDLGLERVRKVAAALDVLQFEVPVITVGGTNGKGSCVALLEAILRAQGYRVGAFTSPHLVRYTERIRIDGREIAEEPLVQSFALIDAKRVGTSLTFFEFNTLAALLAFRHASLDAIVLEVGLGGRLDAVNIVDSDVALLSSVDLDHRDWLGDTLEDIGAEKAGIFRSAKPAIFGSGPIPQSVRAHAERIGANLREPPIDYQATFDAGQRRWTWRGSSGRWNDLPLPALPGRHQLDNAAAVLAVLEQLQVRLPVAREAITAGLESLNVPGRCQRIGVAPQWILDVAHNPAAATQLAATLHTLPAAGRTWAIAGILRDKDAAGVIAPLRGMVQRWVAAELPGPRGTTARELIERVGAAGDSNWLMAPSVEAACEQVHRLAAPEDRILVFGSFHTVGPALQWLQSRPAA